MKTSYILMVVTILSKLFGLLREKALAYFFGTGAVASAFLVAFQVPMTFTNIISGATANGYIPVYNDIEQRSSTASANDFTANLSNLICLIAFVISVLGIVFATPIVKLMAFGFDKATLELAVFMTRVAFLSVAATTVFSVFKAYLQIKEHFVISIAHAIVMNLIIIAAMALSKAMGTTTLAVGILAAFIFQYVIFLPYIHKTGYRHRFTLSASDPHVKQMLKIIVPVLISTSVIELNFIISKSLASVLFEGAMASLNYAYKLQGFVTGIVVTSIVTATYPAMAKLGAAGDRRGLKAALSSALGTMALLVIPASVGLFIFSDAIVNLLFVGGAFTTDDAAVTSLVLKFYAIGIIGIGIREILSRAYYAIMDTRVPMVNSAVIVGVNVVLSLLLMRFAGIRGIAFATSLSFIFGALIMWVSLVKRIGGFLTPALFKDGLKIIVSTVLMAVLSRLVYTGLSGVIDYRVALLLSIGVAGVVYALSCLVLRVSELHGVMMKVRQKLKR
ncbi:murein biosynthesis integral membrane protein MurJ [Peptoniphilus equinus]|uniref:Probable lipid II flippase MurJ n=1 Tax=Peptoniphilus equinus TaxID=3016343 RepID=A0ABY7QSU9_9FIRM|nr:murein biosynthesis integral membrane protein MurJ [Peptoniphilus equinus]WBW49812.1 murein biosynthesis integral membrane protein MurJ [Peptoniphilus equinus]